MSVVFPVAFDIYMCILLNEFTIHFMVYKVRLCGLEKPSQQKNKVEYSQTLYRHADHEKENSE